VDVFFIYFKICAVLEELCDHRSLCHVYMATSNYFCLGTHKLRLKYEIKYDLGKIAQSIFEVLGFFANPDNAPPLSSSTCTW